MLDELKEEGIVNKVGGRFKLSTLIQKRMVMLNAGYKPLVDVHRGMGKMSIVLQEILQDKIYLSPTGEIETVNMSSFDVNQNAILSDISMSASGD